MTRLISGSLALSLFHTALAADCTDSNGKSCDYCLKQSDFEFGTFRALEPGLYCVEEDILFNPNPGTSVHPNDYDEPCWFPTDDSLYAGCIANTDGAYALGFFAMITVEASDIKLDLNGFTLSYHRDFYLQQRWGAIIEISNSPFVTGAGPADFGKEFKDVKNIIIRNGNLGLSSHHGIHANNAQNVLIEDLNIFDFEVGAIQFNGFKKVTMKKLDIGPSLQFVPMTAYYSNARFLILPLQKILKNIKENDLAMPMFPFTHLDDGDAYSLEQVYDNLLLSMDIAFRDACGETTEADLASPLYDISLKLFKNDELLPDGSALYGIVLNSFGPAVNAFGHSPNDTPQKGEDLLIKDVIIDDMRLNVNDIPAMYFDECDGLDTKTILKGPFGEVLNIRLMVNEKDRWMIDHYGQDNVDLSEIQYAGNPLIDAEIAFSLLQDTISDTFVSKTASMSPWFLAWTLKDYGDDNSWPECAAFVCNGDIMFHQNKGVIGLRMDGIEKVDMTNVHISNLINESPLATFTCSNYSGPHDGGHTASITKEREGAMLTDVRGLSICDGDVTLYGDNCVQNLNSFYGDAVGIDLMDDTVLKFGAYKESEMNVDNIDAATKVTQEQYEELKRTGQAPYPNNFEECTIAIDDTSQVVGGPACFEFDDCQNVFEKRQGYGWYSSWQEPITQAYENSFNSLTITVALMIIVFVFFGTRR